MADEIKLQQSSLRNNIMVVFSLTVVIWGVAITGVLQHFLQEVLTHEGLAHEGLVHEGFDKITIDNITRRFTTISTGFTIIGVSVILFIAALLSKTITRPIKKLTEGVLAVAKGKLDARINVVAQDEFGQLATSFNKMTQDLQKTTTSIDRLNREVAKRKKAEEGLKKYTKQVENINRELDDFTYIISHDLKEPLRSIEAFSKFIETDYKDKLDKEGKNYLERIRVNTVRMQNLIENLLEVSRIERRKNISDEADVEGIINEAKFMLEYAIAKKNVKITVQDKLPRLSCDRVRLTEVFFNLISNAIKFNDKSKPCIEIGCTQKDIFYEFYVKDNGPGIEKKYCDAIFQIFQRLGKREDTEGTGVGLAIVKKIIKMHKGEVWVESELKKGTTFYFTIPKERAIILGRKKIGEILTEKKLVSKEDVEKALDEQEDRGARA